MLAKSARLTESADFARATKSGLRASTQNFVGYLYPTNLDQPARAGLIISKNVGGSVTRHKIARKLRHAFRDIYSQLPTGGLLVVYSALLMLVPVPGYGAGQLNAQGSLPWWIDSHLLAGPTWSGAPAPGFDPEGLLSTLPAIATTLLGVLAGQILRTEATYSIKALRLGGLGVTLLISGLGLVPWMPINKNLWTSSFTLFTAGAAAMICAGFYWLIEVRGYRRWATPLIIYGSNAIVIFVLAGLLGRLLGVISWVGPTGAVVSLKGWIYATAFAPYATPVNASLLFAVAFVLLHLLIAGLLWRRQWFVRI